jgi:hypothetical protein
VEGAFGGNIDHAMLVKMYRESLEAKMQKRYSPTKYTGSKVEVMVGNPDRKHISTSQFTRLTNAFSKKVENLAHAVSLHFMYYNFARILRTLRVTPGDGSGCFRSHLEFRGNCRFSELI